MPHVSALDVHDRRLFPGSFCPIRKSRPLTVSLGFRQPHHPVRQVVLDIGKVEHVLSENPGRFGAEVAAGNDELDVIPGIADEGEFPDPRDARGFWAADALDGQPGESLVPQLVLPASEN